MTALLLLFLLLCAGAGVCALARSSQNFSTSFSLSTNFKSVETF